MINSSSTGIKYKKSSKNQGNSWRNLKITQAIKRRSNSNKLRNKMIAQIGDCLQKLRKREADRLELKDRIITIGLKRKFYSMSSINKTINIIRTMINIIIILIIIIININFIRILTFIPTHHSKTNWLIASLILITLSIHIQYIKHVLSKI